MEVTNDIILKGTAWGTAFEKLNDIFSRATHYQIFIVSLAIGIMSDSQIDSLEGEETYSVPRNVIVNHDRGTLDFFYQAALLSSKTVEYDEDTRLEYAFADDVDFDKIKFLRGFANYGVTKLVDKIGYTTLESMDNINKYIQACIEGKYYDLNELSLDDIDLIDDDITK